MTLVARSYPFIEVLQRVRRLSAMDVPVLVAGEPGTGKDAVARHIHSHSLRRAGRFVVVDCRAIPEDLLEKELFGHVRGAFSGAREAQLGSLRAADGGTLCLDGVDDLPLAQQVRLLRAVEAKEIIPLGSSSPLKVDFRLVTTTTRDLAGEVSSGRFRQDLYYRLKVVELRLPPLRERREDIAAVALLFLRRLAGDYHKRATRLSPSARRVLEEHSWPGNLHELRSAMEAALASARGETIEESDLPLSVRVSRPPPADPAAERAEAPPPPVPTFREQVRQFEKQLVLRALARSGWSLKRAASELGLLPHQLKYLCAKLDIRQSRLPG
ncbi:MAG: sigma-54-dependent Fis family transcriptional regulator [Planctomycetes bacterium]|nr:sigma-54-dependent Fis family transcriptional regulator [Planctomycetota bacterium]